jgi:hypothetical protein
MCVDADIELARLRFQLSVRVAMEVDRSLAHLVPRPERIVAQHQQVAVETDLGVLPHGFPTSSYRCRSCIVVADDEVLSALQSGEHVLAGTGPRRLEIAEMPDLIVGPKDLVPIMMSAASYSVMSQS